MFKAELYGSSCKLIFKDKTIFCWTIQTKCLCTLWSVFLPTEKVYCWLRNILLYTTIHCWLCFWGYPRVRLLSHWSEYYRVTLKNSDTECFRLHKKFEGWRFVFMHLREFWNCQRDSVWVNKCEDVRRVRASRPVHNHIQIYKNVISPFKKE